MHAPYVDWKIGCTRTLHWFVESGLFMDKKAPGFMPMNRGEVTWASNQYRSGDWDSHLDEFLVMEYICPISVTRVKCGIRSTLCWKIGNISGSTELFGL